MLVEGLVSYLAADAGMTALLGTPTSRTDKTTGIFPVIAPDSVPMPYCVLQQVSGEPLQISMQGTGRLQTERWRFSCYGINYKNAKSLARALKLAMISVSGALSAGDIFVQGSWQKLEADDAEPIPHGTIYATHVDFEINFTDTAE
jgi:Protein of unknown function (DUF3168)